MRIFNIVLAVLACSSRARRTRSIFENVRGTVDDEHGDLLTSASTGYVPDPKDSLSESQSSRSTQHHPAAAEVSKPSDSFARLLQTLNPANAFDPSGAAAGRPSRASPRHVVPKHPVQMQTLVKAADEELQLPARLAAMRLQALTDPASVEEYSKPIVVDAPLKSVALKLLLAKKANGAEQSGQNILNKVNGGHLTEDEDNGMTVWSMKASVLWCEAAFVGNLYLHKNGSAIYIADGQEVAGRGIGQWVADHENGVGALEMQTFQYAISQKEVPEKPNRFAATWYLAETKHPETNAPMPFHGDWLFVPEDGEAPRRVGRFVAAPTPDTLYTGSLSQMHNEQGDHVEEWTRDPALQRLVRPVQPWIRPGGKMDERIFSYTIGKLSEVQYIPNWITAEQEELLLAQVTEKMKNADQMKTRTSQEWGAGDKCQCGRWFMRAPLPSWQQDLADALHGLGIFNRALYPMNSVRINSYTPGQGIYPHCDGPAYYPRVAILSLGSSCIFDFYPRADTESETEWDVEYDVPAGHRVGDQPLMSVFLERGSLLVFGQDCFWHHRHGIRPVPEDTVTPKVVNWDVMRDGTERVVPRNHRISLTMRHMLPRCACQG